MTTFVLIHGSYQGGWIWKPVATRLREAGHLVFAPSLDGCGERAPQARAGITTETQAEEVAGFLRSEDLTDVVLVGASSGGMIVAKTAELARPRISRLVFADALALKHGERIRDIVTGTGAVVADHAAGPTREQRLQRFLLDMDPDLAEWAADRSTLHPIGVSEQPVVLESFWDQDWDASVVFCRQAGKPGEAHQRRTAEALGARWHELDTGHYPMLSMPDELTRIIVEG
ncbi:MAG: alpha/beta hydrolase family protein [Alphaproteobacteria bacterium]|nr:alpha/beta hydrolase family protein [Alphaproteobacteria bacterium]